MGHVLSLSQTHTLVFHPGNSSPGVQITLRAREQLTQGHSGSWVVEWGFEPSAFLSQSNMLQTSSFPFQSPFNLLGWALDNSKFNLS